MTTNLIERFDLSDIKFQHDWVHMLGKTNIRVLFVTDARFADTNSVYQYMNGKTLGCSNITVKRALYTYGGGALQVDNSPSDNQPHYSNFKFNSTHDGDLLLDSFDVMFIFAVSTGNPEDFPDAELAALHGWMNRGHGVFATGDHSILGQKMGSRIPRVGTMRKWTDDTYQWAPGKVAPDDNVPPGGGINRIDTNQPDPNHAGQVAGTSTIPNSAQGDAYPQKIDWIPVRKTRVSSFHEVHYPHEVLCHPVHGPIDVMPDHPHEGECFNPSRINLNAKVRFAVDDDQDDDEYPNLGRRRERPQIIATGDNSHEYQLAKGAVRRYTFNMISVYDGHKVNVGRVAVDSTWHHWYGMNIDGLEAAGGENWDKIGRYFLNLAKYLAPKGLYRNRCYLDIVDAKFRYPFNEELVLEPQAKDIQFVGRKFRETLTPIWGPCSVLSFVIRHICDIKPWLCKFLERELIPKVDLDDVRGPEPVCLSCPPPDLLIDYVLGGIAQQTDEISQSLERRFEGLKDKRESISVDEIEKLAKVGAEVGVNQFLERLEKDIERTRELWLSNR